MFVQLNPDATSYSESMSTLKFAERVSGVELGAAKSSKDGRDVRELMGQVSVLLLSRVGLLLCFFRQKGFQSNYWSQKMYCCFL